MRHLLGKAVQIDGGIDRHGALAPAARRCSCRVRASGRGRAAAPPPGGGGRSGRSGGGRAVGRRQRRGGRIVALRLTLGRQPVGATAWPHAWRRATASPLRPSPPAGALSPFAPVSLFLGAAYPQDGARGQSAADLGSVSPRQLPTNACQSPVWSEAIALRPVLQRNRHAAHLPQDLQIMGIAQDGVDEASLNPPMDEARRPIDLVEQAPGPWQRSIRSGRRRTAG